MSSGKRSIFTIKTRDDAELASVTVDLHEDASVSVDSVVVSDEYARLRCDGKYWRQYFPDESFSVNGLDVFDQRFSAIRTVAEWMYENFLPAYEDIDPITKYYAVTANIRMGMTEISEKFNLELIETSDGDEEV